MPHLHASVLDFLVFLAYLIIAQLIWRLLAARYSDRPFGKALAALN